MAEFLSTQEILNRVFDRTTNKLNITGGSSAITIGTTAITGATQGSVLFVGAATVIQEDNTNFFWDDTNNRFGLGTPTPSATLDIMQAVVAGATPQAFELVGGAHTTAIAGAELTDVNWNLARTVQFATGAIVTQRTIRFQAPTYAFVGASTVTTAVTLEVDLPVAGTNATITNNFAGRFNGTLAVNATTVRQITLQGSSANTASIVANGANTTLILGGSKTVSATGNADVRLDSTATRTAGAIAEITNNATLRFAFNFFGGMTLTQGVGNNGVFQSLLVTRANHTAQTAGTEINDLSFTDYTRTWATGAIATQREYFFGQPTYAFVGASVVTTAATVYIKGEPLAGSNGTITTAYALWVDSGTVQLDGALNVVGITTLSAALRENVSTLADGATPALNAALGNIFILVAAGDRTIAVPSNAVSGQKIIIRHNASGGARTLSLNTGAGGFRFGTDITALTATSSGKTDYIGCIYNATDSFWDVVSYTKGF